MKQETRQDKEMSNIQDTSSCARVGDLVANLYGETNETEARDFQNHVSRCSTCRDELSAFADVRGGIVMWRDKALNTTTVLTPDVVRQRIAEQPMAERSAIVALREFFSLSPIWLRGATAFAAILFVALLLVTALRFFEHVETPVAQQTPSVRPIDEVKQPPVEQAKDIREVSTPATTSSNKDQPVRAQQRKRVETVAQTKSNRRSNSPDLSNEELSQLSDLLIAAKDDEESIPRLYDLISESN